MTYHGDKVKLQADTIVVILAYNQDDNFSRLAHLYEVKMWGSL
jgi:hypothetical protein